jgi:hypothetical protein
MSDEQSHAVSSPTGLTTEAIDRAVKAERDYVDGRIEVLEARLDGIDEATKVLHETVTRIPTDVQREVAHIRELIDQALVSAEKLELERIAGADERTNAVKRELVIVQEESEKAIGKAEGATEKRFDSLKEVVDTQISDIRRALADLSVKVSGLV